MTQTNELTAYWAKAPVALIIGCGGMGVASARVLGRRHPLMMIDIDITVDGGHRAAWHQSGLISR